MMKCSKLQGRLVSQQNYQQTQCKYNERAYKIAQYCLYSLNLKVTQQFMGNKVLGRRSRSFYRGFSERQIEYLKQKYQMVSTNGKLDKVKFMEAYKLNDAICDKFLSEADFDEDSNMDEYQFICMVHTLCSKSIEELGSMFFRILTKGKSDLNEKSLFNFSKTCLQYIAYMDKTPIQQKQIAKSNKNKFEKYDFDKNKVFDESEFKKICLKDEDYKKWMFYMGFISKRQMDFQQDVYDLVDSDIADQIDRHDKQNKSNISKIKQGAQHRADDDQFLLQQVVGQQSVPQQQPWRKSTKKVKVSLQNLQPPNQSLTIDYVFGYRSFDCRNNVKFDHSGKVVYHQAAMGIVLDPIKKTQQYILQHHEDITCLDLVGDTVITGDAAAKPTLLIWGTGLKDDQLQKKIVITELLQNGISSVCLSDSKSRVAAICNDYNHKLVVYDCLKLQKIRADPTLKQNSIIAVGPTTINIPFDLKFDVSQKYIALATLRELLFITFEKGTLNSNRGQFGNFTVTPALCLQPLKCKYKGEAKQYMISGMGNGSLYFWEKQICVKAVSGHQGSVSAICNRKDVQSFVSGDKLGNIIIWNEKFQKQKTITVPKSNCPSNMIVSLSCSKNRELLVGTKASDIFIVKLGDSFDKANKIMSGHNDGKLNTLAIHRSQNFLYTGGEDQRLMKWEYVKQRRLQKQRKCPYPIKSIDLYIKSNNNADDKKDKSKIVVGYKNGVVECFDPDTLQILNKVYAQIKNPDQEVLNFVRINKDGNMCIACYLYPKFKIVILNLYLQNKIGKINQIPMSSRVTAVDFDKQSKYIRVNTAKYEYLVYNIDDFKNPFEVKNLSEVNLDPSQWATHTIPCSPQTQGVFCEGVLQTDITCCERSRKYRNVFVVGDKYSKIKLFNYPSQKNKIYNKYVGHSNQVTGLQFDRSQQYLVSIGGEQKSIIVWKYNAEQAKNEWFIKKLAPESDVDNQEISEARKKKKQLLSQYDVETVQGQQAMATKAFAGQIKNPSDFKQNYNAKRDNKLPDQQISIEHVFGLRNKYLNDEVRNQAKFSSTYKQVLFPTACLGVKMQLGNKKQQYYHAHRQDIVSFAVDPTRKIMATGQMAQKNPAHPRKKIVSIYVWDVNTKQVLQKLDGFHTIAIVLLSFSPDSKLLFTCGNDQKNTFAVYDWMSGAILFSGPTSMGKVNGMSWKTNQQFMTCGMDHVKFWTGRKSQMGKTTGKVESMFSCVNSKKIYITGSGDGGIYNWLGNRSKQKIKGHSGKVHTLVFYNDFVYSGGDDGKINAWRTEANGQIKVPQQFYDTRSAFQQLLKTINNMPQQQFGVLSIDFSPNKDLLIGTVGASIIYFSGKQSKIVHQGHYKGQLWGLTTQVRKNEDKYIITGGDDKSIRLWDIKQKKEVNRAYFEKKIRGLDWSPDGQKIVIGDSRAKIYLYNNTLTKMLDEYTGKPYDFNKGQKIDPFIEDIKFSPDGKSIVYGCHGKSMYMQILDIAGTKLKNKKTFTHGSSALLHVDWSRDSSFIGLNTQAYQLLFYNTDGKMISASSTADQKWATWTRKIGFQVKGIFQGIDYSDVNTVCRDPTGKFLAVGYDDQTIRIFNYPAYIPQQVFKTYYGHSSHVTRIKFTSEKMVSLGGNDRTIIVWNVQRPNQQKDDGQESDGLDDLEEDVDLPSKAVTRKPKPTKIDQFYQNEEEGDEFMAIKPWLGAIKQPTYEIPKQSTKEPDVSINLQYVHGYRVKDCRQNLYYNDRQTIIFHAAAVLIYHNIVKNEQLILNTHQDDILSIDYHRATNQVITGQLGPKPLVCLFKDSKLIKTFTAPVKKGVLAIAISPDGKKAACAGMDDDHCVSVLDLQSGKVITTVKGTKKVITKIVWISNYQFVSVGISHYKLWTLDKALTGKESPKRYNFVSVAYDEQTKKVFTGASKGTIIVWNGSDPQKTQISLTRKVKNGQQVQQVDAAVVDCLLIEKNLLLAGTKDGSIFVIDKKTKQVLNEIVMEDQFRESDIKSQCPGIRAMSILNNKLLVGTLGSQIYQFEIESLTNGVKQFKNATNILKCHFSPNNTWTNEVWGLHIKDDYIFTCSDDATVRCWSISQRKHLSCSSTNVFKDGDAILDLQMDGKTKDFTDAAKSRAVCVSPDGKEVIVGAKNGTVRVYTFNHKDCKMKLKNVFRHAKQWISDIKFGYNTLIIGSHDNAIYVYNYEEGQIKRKYAPLKKHSSYITHIDVSRDSCFLQSTCGAYQLLFWDLNSGKQMTGGATMLRDERWATWTCNLGWPVQGIYPPCTDGTFINSVDQSNLSVRNTLAKDDAISPYLLATGNDNGKVGIYNFPCTIKGTKSVQGKGHSSHVTNVRWSNDDKYIISVGGQDQCLMYWKIQKKR